ncbi:MAG: hypothetical protein A2600_14210 [Candidatus Lambdaproteobacteria bacterium RIFOXYD1_FULL_56_27]|nr:MAG: hypothetical protein A2426_03550 [Candidatus Lambdaproteobacteria bacterium RIFOXYC1_FULL_56_13]OGH06713.1 MAG: hypothetical protein A2600_14210 [Candidatus Lambdaproteobacteria bacterium RIFOXYD1_FULL_56_27]
MVTLEKKQRQLPLGQWIWFQGGQGPALVLFPGFGDSHKTFLRLGRELAQDFEVFLPETPGFGETEPLAPSEYRLSRQVARCWQWLEALGLQRPFLGGNSAGGQLAALLALERPAQVRGLVLLAPQGVETADFVPYSHKNDPPQSLEDFRGILAKLYHRPPELPQEQLAQILAKAQSRWDWLNQIRAEIRCEPEYRLNDRLAGLKPPALVLWGEQDGRIPTAIAPHWKRLCPQVRLERIEACGHLPQLEQTARTAQQVRRFGLGLAMDLD